MVSEFSRRIFLKNTGTTWLTLQPISKMALGMSKPALSKEELLARPVEKIYPDWLDETKGYELPQWYDKWRICLHTRLAPIHLCKQYHPAGSSKLYYDEPMFLTAAKAFRSLGTNVFVRHIKTGGESAWWPSKVGATAAWAKERNYAKEIIDNAHKAGCRIIVYHRHMEDEYMAKQHPDWICRINPQGETKNRRGLMMCFNSPYADYLLKRLLELTDMGADGFYFDEVHMPKSGCWCKYCRKKFKKMTGLEHPKAQNNNDPVWRKLRDFNNFTIEQTFFCYRRVLHARNPQLVMLIGNNMAPCMFDRHMTHRVSRIADSIKSEYHTGAIRSVDGMLHRNKMKQLDSDARLALGYTMCRDGADGRPAHIWTPRIGDENSAIFATTGIITHGCIANLDHAESEIPNPAKFKKAIELGNRISPWFAKTLPLHWAAVHYPEDARDQLYSNVAVAWKKALYPMAAVYQVLLRNHLPVGVITDSQLEEGLIDGYKVLFLPAPDFLTEAMGESVESFKRNGGIVINQRDDWKWYDANGGWEKAESAFMNLMAEYALQADVQAFGGNEKMHMVAFKAKQADRITVALVNDFIWVDTFKRINRQGKKIKVPDYVGKVPPSCKGVRVEVRRKERPKKVFDAVTNRELKFEQIDSGIVINVPDFEASAVVVVEYI
ncbi:MAG: alpha-amylase family protein [Planctomycetota bacterium]|jgi:hypothetical protein